jgi:hypothetical protein
MKMAMETAAICAAGRRAALAVVSENARAIARAEIFAPLARSGTYDVLRTIINRLALVHRCSESA